MRPSCWLSLVFCVPVCVACCVSSPRPLCAQTYTPRAIRFEGGGDPAELLRLTGLQPGTPLSKAEIEAAMGKLADTGAFTDLSYTVSSQALVIKLTGALASSGQAMPVSYLNLVWWQPEELTRLLEQRVPLFRGELPLTGTLTDQVRTAVVQLLAEKGVANATVEANTFVGAANEGPAGKGSAAGRVALSIVRPHIVLGNVSLPGAVPATQHQLDVVIGVLSTQDFETAMTSREIVDNVGDTEKNAGFLEATVEPPVYTAPRKDMHGYAVDVTAAVHPGDLYRIGVLDVQPPPPLSRAEALNATGLKPGEPAGANDITLSKGKVQHTYDTRGYLDARVEEQTLLDKAAHTATLRYTIEPGELYHLASVDTSALPAEQQAAFAREFRSKPGADAGTALEMEIERALTAARAPRGLTIRTVRNAEQHTITEVIQMARARSGGPRPAGD